MKIRSCAAIAALALLALAGCTEKQRARSFGGETSVDLRCGQKLFDVTWKESGLWYASRPMREGEQPETYTFQEDSSYGVLEGSVTFNESRCVPTA